jgi:hypothetical protein
MGHAGCWGEVKTESKIVRMKTANKYPSIKRLSGLSFFLFLLALSATAQNIPPLIRPQVAAIAQQLQKDNRVHFGYPVGYSGRPETNNKYYRLYRRLAASATEQELIELTNDPSKALVVYAFAILHARKSNGLKTVFLHHINDTAWFWTAGGCTGTVNRVNWFMLRRLKPTGDGNAPNTLTKEEYALYCKRFNAADNIFTCE